MCEKDVSEMTEKEILRQQLELIAEKSKGAEGLELQGLTLAMTDIVCNISCLYRGEGAAKKTVRYPAVEELKTEQQHILCEFSKSAKAQKRMSRIQSLCLAGMLINSIAFLIYLLGHL